MTVIARLVSSYSFWNTSWRSTTLSLYSFMIIESIEVEVLTNVYISLPNFRLVSLHVFTFFTRFLHWSTKALKLRFNSLNCLYRFSRASSGGNVDLPTIRYSSWVPYLLRVSSFVSTFVSDPSAIEWEMALWICVIYQTKDETTPIKISVISLIILSLLSLMESRTTTSTPDLLLVILLFLEHLSSLTRILLDSKLPNDLSNANIL